MQKNTHTKEQRKLPHHTISFAYLSFGETHLYKRPRPLDFGHWLPRRWSWVFSRRHRFHCRLCRPQRAWDWDVRIWGYFWLLELRAELPAASVRKISHKNTFWPSRLWQYCSWMQTVGLLQQNAGLQYKNGNITSSEIIHKLCLRNFVKRLCWLKKYLGFCTE